MQDTVAMTFEISEFDLEVILLRVWFKFKTFTIDKYEVYNIMIFKIIFSTILGFCALNSIIKKRTLTAIFLPLIAAGLLWTRDLYSHISFIYTVINIVFWLIAIGAILDTAFSFVYSIFDKDKDVPPIVIGEGNQGGEVYIIYHPGNSDFTTKVLTSLAKALSENNYKVTLFSSSPDLQLDLTKAVAVGISSNIIAGTIRTSINKFIENHNFEDVKFFIPIIGAVAQDADNELYKINSMFINLMQNSGVPGELIGKAKFIKKNEEKAIEEAYQFGQAISKEIY